MLAQLISFGSFHEVLATFVVCALSGLFWKLVLVQTIGMQPWYDCRISIICFHKNVEASCILTKIRRCAIPRQSPSHSHTAMESRTCNWLLTVPLALVSDH